MPQFARIVAIPAVLIVLAGSAAAGDLPAWAYPVNPPGGTPAPDNGIAQHVPDSAAAFTRGQIGAAFSTGRIAAHTGTVVDWHPADHPAMPEIVARSREPNVYACGSCHLPTGAGRPENASIAGLTPGYIKQQMAAFRNGDRPGSEPNRLPQTVMIAIARAVTDSEIDAAAAYFASIKPSSYVKVVETALVPKTIVAGWTLTTAPGGAPEPISNRIIEMPEDFGRFENRDSRTPYVAYVPVGSIKRGAELVATGAGGRSVICATCHGPELKGLVDVPRLVGRSPSYLIRQLHDLKHGARKGGTAELMKPVVANLTDDDLIAIVAYLASREP